MQERWSHKKKCFGRRGAPGALFWRARRAHVLTGKLNGWNFAFPTTKDRGLWGEQSHNKQADDDTHDKDAEP